MPFDRKEYMKEYYEKNKEKLDKKNKDYRENNKEKIKERKKEQMKEYRQTENGKKIITICSWKKHEGIIS